MLEDTRRILAKEDAVADAVHRRTLGADYKPPDEEDMGNIHVGDMNVHQVPQPQQPKGNGVQTAVMAAALAAATGMSGYMLAGKSTQQPIAPQPAIPEFDDETLTVGLGRIEDYLKTEGK